MKSFLRVVAVLVAYSIAAFAIPAPDHVDPGPPPPIVIHSDDPILPPPQAFESEFWVSRGIYVYDFELDPVSGNWRIDFWQEGYDFPGSLLSTPEHIGAFLSAIYGFDQLIDYPEPFPDEVWDMLGVEPPVAQGGSGPQTAAKCRKQASADCAAMGAQGVCRSWVVSTPTIRALCQYSCKWAGIPCPPPPPPGQVG